MYIKLRVLAGAKKESFAEESKKPKNHFIVSVKEKAERNMANRRVVELAARYFGIPAGKARIISGHQSPGKILSLDIGD